MVIHRYSKPHEDQTRYNPDSRKKDVRITQSGMGIDRFRMDDCFLFQPMKRIPWGPHRRPGIQGFLPKTLEGTSGINSSAHSKHTGKMDRVRFRKS
jgi:hypothetical protein